MSRHPDVCQRQAVVWDAKLRQLSSSLHLPESDRKHAEEAKATVAALHSPSKRRRSHSRSVSFSDQSDSDDASTSRRRPASGARARHQSSGPVKVKREPQSSGDENAASNIITKSRKIKLTREANVCDSTSSTQIPDAAMANGLDEQPAATASPAFDSVFKTSTDSNVSPVLKQELTDFLTRHLSKHILLKLSDIKRLITLEIAQKPAGHVFGAGSVTDQLIDECVNLCGGRRLKPSQVKLEQPFYVYFKSEGLQDKVKQLVLTMLEQSDRFKKKTLKDELSEKLPTVDISDNQLRKILKDYCDLKGPYYYLKTT